MSLTIAFCREMAAAPKDLDLRLQWFFVFKQYEQV